MPRAASSRASLDARSVLLGVVGGLAHNLAHLLDSLLRALDGLDLAIGTLGNRVQRKRDLTHCSPGLLRGGSHLLRRD